MSGSPLIQSSRRCGVTLRRAATCSLPSFSIANRSRRFFDSASDTLALSQVLLKFQCDRFTSLACSRAPELFLTLRVVPVSPRRIEVCEEVNQLEKLVLRHRRHAGPPRPDRFLCRTKPAAQLVRAKDPLGDLQRPADQRARRHPVHAGPNLRECARPAQSSGWRGSQGRLSFLTICRRCSTKASLAASS
jgi:hypothetical protein